MNVDLRTQVRWLVACLVVIAGAAILAWVFEHGFGRIDIQTVKIYDPSNVVLTAKVYRPVTATAENKLPGILNLHGYQNDKDVQTPYSIELARRGFVVLALDQIGHGDSKGSFNLALYRTNPKHTVGAESGYHYLKSLPFVDAARLGVMGHSLGALNSLKVAILNPDHRAADFIAGVPGPPTLHNVLLTQARFDEFPIFRENQGRVEPLGSHPNRMKAFGRTDPVAWDTTYGNFADGTARRAALIQMEHHFLSVNGRAIAEAADWMRLSLKDGKEDVLWIAPTSQIFIWKELFGLVALLVTAFSMIPLANILLATKFFGEVAQPVPAKPIGNTRTWWLFATISAVIGGILYPPLTSITALADKVQPVVPFLKLSVGNGLLLWFTCNAIIGGLLFWLWYRTVGRQARLSMADLGANATANVLCKTLLLGVILFAWMYVLEGISQWALGQEFRFVWPYMRQFSGPLRFGLFLIYLIPALAFFLINGGLFMYGQNRPADCGSPARNQWFWWLKCVYAGLAGLAIAWAVQYVPWFFFGAGPGYEELGLPTFSALWPLMLQVYIPEFAILLFLLTWFYRRTGRIYLGALMASSLAVWFLAAGSVIARV